MCPVSRSPEMLIPYRQCLKGTVDRGHHAATKNHTARDAQWSDESRGNITFLWDFIGYYVAFLANLVGGLEHGPVIFPFSWECHHPNWRTHIFQRGGEKPPTRNNLGFCVGNSLIKPTKLSPKNVSACGGSDQQMGRVYQEEVGCKGLPTQNQYNWSFLPWISLEPQVAVIVHCSSSYIKPKPHKPATSRGEHLHMKCWIQVGFACVTCRRFFPYVPWSKASAYTQSLGNGHQSVFRWIGIRFVRNLGIAWMTSKYRDIWVCLEIGYIPNEIAI